jgi:hypothetical protein
MQGGRISPNRLGGWRQSMNAVGGIRPPYGWHTPAQQKTDETNPEGFHRAISAVPLIVVQPSRLQSQAGSLHHKSGRAATLICGARQCQLCSVGVLRPTCLRIGASRRTRWAIRPPYGWHTPAQQKTDETEHGGSSGQRLGLGGRGAAGLQKQTGGPHHRWRLGMMIECDARECG